MGAELSSPLISQTEKLHVISLDFGQLVKEMYYRLTRYVPPKKRRNHEMMIMRGHWTKALPSKIRVPGYGFVATTELPLRLSKTKELEPSGCYYILEYRATGFSGDTIEDKLKIDPDDLTKKNARRDILEAAHFIDGWLNVQYRTDQRTNEIVKHWVDFGPLRELGQFANISHAEYKLYQISDTPSEKDELTTINDSERWSSNESNYYGNGKVELNESHETIGIKIHFITGGPIWRVFDLKALRKDVQQARGKAFSQSQEGTAEA